MKDKLHALLKDTNIEPNKAFYSPQEIEKCGYRDANSLIADMNAGRLLGAQKVGGRWRLHRSGWLDLIEQSEIKRDVRFIKSRKNS